MISTPVAPSQHPHNLSLPTYAPFRDHLRARRQSSQHAMHQLPPHLRDPALGKNIDGAHNQMMLHPPRQSLHPDSQSSDLHLGRQSLGGVSEHMLRRKTPNGTLKAGYDGTPVDWASGPPAHKHHAVRNGLREDNVEAAFRRQTCFLLSGPAAQPLPYPPHPATPRDSYPVFGPIYEGVNAGQRQMLHGQGQGPQLDSMLFQATPHPQAFQNAYAQIPIAMQPTWPRNIEPTASGPPMPYGPYWPNGTFEPYRAAPSRDARFDSQLAQMNLNDQEIPAWQRNEPPRDRFRRDSVYLGPASTPGVGGIRLDAQPAFQHQRPLQSSYFPEMQRPAFQPEDQMSHLNSANFFNNNPLAPADPTSSSLLFPPSSSEPSPLQALQFKEQTLSEAHRVYMALVQSHTHTRKQMQLNKQSPRNMPSMNLFPKPLRQFYNLDGNSPGLIPDLRMQGRTSYPAYSSTPLYANGFSSIQPQAEQTLDNLRRMIGETNWTWTEAILLAGCLAYGLNHFQEAVQLFQKVLTLDASNVEAMSNLAAAHMTLGQRNRAEKLWTDAVSIRPGYFEAVEHLVGLLCSDNRSQNAVEIIQLVEQALRSEASRDLHSSQFNGQYKLNDLANGSQYSTANVDPRIGYSNQPKDNGRLIALIHAKGNMLYGQGNILGAAEAFEEAIMVAVGKTVDGISGLIRRILGAFAEHIRSYKHQDEPSTPWETILLLPTTATKTTQLTFPNSKPLPGLDWIEEGSPKRAAIAVTSNCLLSLAKIYQDSMSSGGPALGPSGATGVQDILALYFLSLSLQPSPSTANNVGILLAGVQQSASSRLPLHLLDKATPEIAGVVPGTGVALALAYYNYGLMLDKEHAHLFTNLGSLLKDLGQLDLAIRMYEEAVRCDGKFDIALANLANAVKDRGRVSEAIGYYRRAVEANGDFAEAVCGLANALNSVCDWIGRGGIVFGEKRFDRWHVNDEGTLVDAKNAEGPSSGWIGRVVTIVNKQLASGRAWGKNLLTHRDAQALARNSAVRDHTQHQHLLRLITTWMGQDYEGAKVVRFVERATRQIGWQWYQDKHVKKTEKPMDSYRRPQLPAALTVPNAPTVLPFHTFTCPLTASQIRQISQRNGLRISASTLKAPWLDPHVYKPPPPPSPYLNVGYVSSDFNNHPLAHLMQSVFGMHNPSRVHAVCYATTPSDNSIHRQKIEREAPRFYDASSWPMDRLVKQIVEDKIHILVNLNGYTRGARNEVFAARPAPIQMSFMGFAGTLGAEWCDYLLADETAVPVSTLRPCRDNISLQNVVEDDNFDDCHQDWVYGENIIYTRDTFFCCDHRQSAPDAGESPISWRDELSRRRHMRKELFPDLADDMVILGNFNQLYKIEPTTFRTWLRILQAVPKSILWLLRFPDLGESNLRAMAKKWSTPDVSSRIIFTDVAPKEQHIARARICDLFLDTPECNAHTTSADVLWSGTPLLTYPRYEYKMCSRMAASILKGAMPRGQAGQDAADELIVESDEAYEAKAIDLSSGLAAVLAGTRSNCRALEIRRLIYEGRRSSPLFDTKRWTRDLEEAYRIAWERWERRIGGDIWL